MQRVLAFHRGELVARVLPSPDQPVPGHQFSWGGAEEIGSPAYWAAQAWMWELNEPDHFRLGHSLRDELIACMLGGYGIPAEVGLAAFDRLRSQDSATLKDEAKVCDLLREPLAVKGKHVRYRFAQQKARYIAAAVAKLDVIDLSTDDRSLRNQLVQLDGVGPKTASWVVRNWRGSDAVSILDVHIVRVSRLIGLFEPEWRVERHYEHMEAAYLRFAEAIDARASILDSVMWMTMRQLPPSIVSTMVAPSKHQPPVVSPGRDRTPQLSLF